MLPPLSPHILGFSSWSPTMAVPNRKSEGRGNWELPYMAASLGKSRAEKSDGEYRPVSQEGNKKEGLCWRRDAGRSLGSELR